LAREASRAAGRTLADMTAADGGGDVLFVFAHQDDEVGISTRIGYEVRAGSRVWCIYLTDGATAVASEVRDAESLRALRRLGVERERIGFLADAQGRIADGALYRALPRARAMLRDWIASTGARFARVFTLDWEGGHHDHDAAHLLALAAARDAAVPAVYAYAFYNAYRRRPGLFRVASFVPGDEPLLRRALRLREAVAAAALVTAYPSQRRTWIGLGPGFVARMLLQREERFRRADPARVARRPHPGPLLYETMFAIPADAVLAASAQLRAELSGGAGAASARRS
jgi:LmbE family N-acetylglucosaminyl deacetylase